MNEQVVIDLMMSAIRTVIVVSAPPLLIGLIAGLAVSIFQTITSIQDATLAFVPKILAIFLSIALFGSFMMTTLMEFTKSLLTNLYLYVR